jgi:hypothetical protein
MEYRSTLIEKLVQIAVFSHKDETRKGDGTTYITHPIMVALKNFCS